MKSSTEKKVVEKYIIMIFLHYIEWDNDASI